MVGVANLSLETSGVFVVVAVVVSTLSLSLSLADVHWFFFFNYILPSIYIHFFPIIIWGFFWILFVSLGKWLSASPHSFLFFFFFFSTTTIPSSLLEFDSSGSDECTLETLPDSSSSSSPSSTWQKTTSTCFIQFSFPSQLLQLFFRVDIER